MSSKTAGNNFDIIRFAFASLVILSHSFPMATGNEAHEPLMLLSHGQMTLGTLSVDSFFIISGYLIAQSWTRKPEVTAYLSKRIRRIYPGFLVAAALCAFVIAPAFSGDPARSGVDSAFIVNFLEHAPRLIFIAPGEAFLDNPAPGSVNGSLWSIPFEFWCYIGLMAVGKLGLFKRPTWLALALFVLTVASFVVAWNDMRIGGKFLGVIFGYPTFWARLLPYFVAGMVFHAFGDRIVYTGYGAIVASVLMLVACFVPFGLIFVLPVCASYVILWLAFIPTRHLRHFARRGDYSYGIYLYAFPIGQMIEHWSGTHSPWWLFAMAWPASVLAGALSWHLVEHRCMKAPSAPRALAQAS